MQKYDYIGKESEGLIRVKNGLFKNEKCGYIDKTGKEVIPLIYSGVRDFHEGMAAVKIGNWASGKWGFINIKGELIIPFLFDKPREFSSGLAKVIYNDEWFFIDPDGYKIIYLNDYDGSSNFHNGYAIVKKDGTTSRREIVGIIDKTGTEVIPCAIKSIHSSINFTCSKLEESVHSYKNRSKDSNNQ